MLVIALPSPAAVPAIMARAPQDYDLALELMVRLSEIRAAKALARVFRDDTPEDRAAIQSVINQVVFYPLSAFDPTMKTIAWAQAPTLPGPAAEGGGETKWVVPEKFFDQLGTVLDTVPPLSGEETLYGQFRVLLDSAEGVLGPRRQPVGEWRVILRRTAIR